MYWRDLSNLKIRRQNVNLDSRVFPLEIGTTVKSKNLKNLKNLNLFFKTLSSESPLWLLELPNKRFIIQLSVVRSNHVIPTLHLLKHSNHNCLSQAGYLRADLLSCHGGTKTSVWVLVYNRLEKFENAALFPTGRHTTTRIHHENGAFWKRSLNGRNLKTPSFRFRVEEKNFENGAFRKRWRHGNQVISLTQVFSTTIQHDRW